MADRRPELEDSGRKKRQKTSASSPELDPKANPYLAHMYEDPPEEDDYQNEYIKPMKRNNGVGGGASALSNFPRHATDAAMAKKVEDGPNNPFNGKPLSKQYFKILETRRNLPVHAQRWVILVSASSCQSNRSVETNFLKHTTNRRF